MGKSWEWGRGLAERDRIKDLFDRLSELNDERAERGFLPVAIGTGMHSGKIIAGNVGSERKLQFTVIGDTVNVASRLENLNKECGTRLTLSETTYKELDEAARDLLELRPRKVEIRGKEKLFKIYQLV